MLFFSYSLSYEQEIKRVASSITFTIIAGGSKVKRVAVVDFTDLQGGRTEFGRFMAEELSVRMAKQAIGFKVVDRIHISKLIEEQKFNLSGLVDKETAKNFGRLVGADAIVTGSYAVMPNGVRLNVKLINTETGEVLTGTQVDFQRTKFIDELLSKRLDTGLATDVQKPPERTQTAPQTTPTVAGVRMRRDVDGSYVFEYMDFEYRIKGCRRIPATSNYVDCYYEVKNLGRSGRAFSIEFFEAVDDRGYRYQLSESVSTDLNADRSYSSYFYLNGVPTRSTKFLEIRGRYRGANSLSELLNAPWQELVISDVEIR
ncbi:MAG: FlgO family outer membrane protein [Aquificaceae bacterium]|nr:FlgO family outer membrane protein [Aquificaceae bacterium]